MNLYLMISPMVLTNIIKYNGLTKCRLIIKIRAIGYQSVYKGTILENIICLHILETTLQFALK